MTTIFIIIENEIREMSFGQAKFYGRNIRLEDMMGVYHFLRELQYEGLIEILTVNYQFMADIKLVDWVKIQRI